MDKTSDHFYVTFIAYLDSSQHSDEWYNKNKYQITVFEQVTADFVYVYLYFCFVFFVFFFQNTPEIQDCIFALP